MRLHLLDPQLYTADGHYLNYDTAVVEEFRRRGVETNIYGAAIRQGTQAQTLAAEHVFMYDIFQEAPTEDRTWALQSFTQMNGFVREDLATIVPGRFSNQDLAFFPNLTHNQLDGVRQWIMQLPEARRPTLVVKLSYLMHELAYVKARGNYAIIVPMFRSGIRQLVATHPRTAICSDTEDMVEAFHQISGVPVTLLPMPMAMDHLGQAPDRPTAAPERPCVAYLGHAIPRKGFHLLPEIIRLASAGPNPPQFLVQYFGGHPTVVEKIEKELAVFPPSLLTVVRGTLDAAGYARLLHQADIVLFPYFKEFYGWASSGVFTEAMSLGKVSVAPADTWIARQLKQYDGGGVIFSSPEPEPIAAAVRQACAELGERQVRARNAAEAFRREHCAANFVDKLIAAARAAGARPAS